MFSLIRCALAIIPLKAQFGQPLMYVRRTYIARELVETINEFAY